MIKQQKSPGVSTKAVRSFLHFDILLHITEAHQELNCVFFRVQNDFRNGGAIDFQHSEATTLK